MQRTSRRLSRNPIRFVIEAEPSDIEKYVHDKLDNSDGVDTFDLGFRNLVVEKISQGCHQM